MELTELISTIAIVSSFIIGLAGIIFNTYIQRKNNSIKVITSHRFERRKRMQELVAELLSNSDPYLINLLATEEDKQKVIIKICNATNEFRTIFMFSVKQDKDFIQQVYEFRKTVYDYIIEKRVKLEDLKLSREELSRTCDIYASTDWKRIKNETCGKERLRSKNNWYKTYEKYLENFPNEKADK